MFDSGGTSFSEPTASAESVSRRNIEHRRARIQEVIRGFFRTFGYHAGPALERVVAIVAEQIGITALPRPAFLEAGRVLDRWLHELVVRLGVAPVTVETARAALVAMDVGQRWPDALFCANPGAPFCAEFCAALPIALPPPAQCEMPIQSLITWSEAPSADPSAYRARGVAVRRGCVFGLSTLATAAATFTMYRVFTPGGISAIEVSLMVLFAVNFFWIALTFWTGLMGLRASVRRRTQPGIREPEATTSVPRTAILLPTYNEDPARVFASVKAIYQSVAATGELAAFDFYVLSDSTDPDCWIAEELAWDRIRRELNAGGRLFYRRRFENTAKKAGNIAEFCRRWGGRYVAMLILDADSLMEGTTIIELCRTMAANPNIGILQTVPQLINRNTLFARVQQFAGRVYGPLLAAGLAEWCGGDGNYWGHNALIRVAAFTAHAGMPSLPGRAPFGGHILSHDFVEAALIRRAGYGVFLMPRLGGSYEETPPSLLDHAQRDRRWCQGNLQHLGVIGAAGLHSMSRWHFATGVMAYLASPLWFLFIVVGILAALQTKFELPQYFFPNRTPYPVWHIIDPELALRLFTVTMVVLLAPKIFAWLALCLQPAIVQSFGGRMRVLLNVIVESLLSALSAPVQMLMQTRFVIDVLFGRDSGWKTQSRSDRGTPLAETWRHHRHHMLVGGVLGIAAYAVSPMLLAWMLPALVGMVLAAGVSHVGSRLDIGMFARRYRLLLIPEEETPPPILVQAAANLSAAPSSAPFNGLSAVVTDNRIGHLHLALLSQYSPVVVTEAIALAHYRAMYRQFSVALENLYDTRLQAAALADRETVLRLRRTHGHLPG